MGIRLNLVLVVCLLIVPTFALQTAWVKIKDDGLMEYIDLEPLDLPNGDTLFKVTIRPEFKTAYEDYTLGFESKTSYEDWLMLESKNVIVPYHINTGEEIVYKNIDLDSLLKEGHFLIKLDREKVNSIIHFGWFSEEWTLIYTENVTIGVYVDGDVPTWCVDCSTLNESSNMTTTERNVWANVTTNETFWLLNGTTPEFPLFQVWTEIHDDSYNVTFELPIGSNRTNITVNNSQFASELFNTSEPTLLWNDTFDDDDISDWTQDTGDFVVNDGWMSHSGAADWIISPYNASGDYRIRVLWHTGASGKGGVAWNFQAQNNDDHNFYQLDNYEGYEKLYYGERISDSFGSAINSHEIDAPDNTNLLTDVFVYRSNDTYRACLMWENETIIYCNAEWWNDTFTSGYVGFYGSEIMNVSYIEVWNLPIPIDNHTFELNWVTGWAYCTAHANCSVEYYCSMSGDQNSRCLADITPTVEFVGEQDVYPEGNITMFVNVSSSGVVIDNATVWVELYNSSVNGTLLQNVTGNYSGGLYSIPFTNLTEFENYYASANGELQPIYGLDSDTHEFDVVTASLEIIYPLSTDEVYARTIHPRIRLTMSDFALIGECFYDTEQQRSDRFTVSNNVTFNSVPMNPINGRNYMTVSCDIGGLVLKETVEFQSMVVPDVYLLGINLNTHIVSQIMLFYLKQFLWNIGPSLFGFFLILSTIVIAYHYIFKKAIERVT